jgi:hypothetical protein
LAAFFVSQRTTISLHHIGQETKAMRQQNPSPRGHHISDGEAKGTVEEKLRKQQLTKPMSEKEMTTFCAAMSRQLEMKSTVSVLADIRRWAECWQAIWFR